MFHPAYLPNSNRCFRQGSPRSPRGLGDFLSGSLLYLVFSLAIAFPLSWEICAAQTMGWRNQIPEVDAPRLNQLQQVELLVQSKEYGEAIDLLQKIEDEGDGLVVQAGRLPSDSPFVVARYISLIDYCHSVRLVWATRAPEALAVYRQRIDAQSKKAWDEVRKTNRAEEGEKWLKRYIASSIASEVMLWVGDLWLDRGEYQAARECYQRILPGARLSYNQEVRADQNERVGGSVSFSRLLNQCGQSQEAFVAVVEAIKKEKIGELGWSLPAAKVPPADVWARLVWCSILERDLERATLEVKLLEQLYPQENVTLASGKVLGTWSDQLKQSMRDLDLTSTTNNQLDWRQLGGNASRNELSVEEVRPSDWPRWTHPFYRLSAAMDRNPAGRPRVGEGAESVLSYHPVVDKGRVYVNDLQRIYALDLETGSTWPSADPKLPLFDSGIPVESVVPLAYPNCGVPRSTLAISENQLFAKMGLAITGWKQTPLDANGSLSFIVGLDLARDGRMLEGYPIYLTGPKWANCEFDGCPLPVGDRLLVCITERTNVQINRFIAAFERNSGKLLWRTMPLAAGMIEGLSDANLISHQLLSYSNGTVYLNTGLGIIAAVDYADGSLKWLTRYPRSQLEDSAYPVSQRFRFRDMTPCLIQEDTIYCCPADSPEIFALDAATGDLVWSATPEHSADVIHLLHAGDGQLIGSGDRLVWFDAATGKMRGSFPEGIAARPGEGLAEPRGLGRPWVSKELIFFPTENRIHVLGRKLFRQDGKWVLDKKPAIDLASRASEGGNLILSDNWLLLATPSRLVAFATPEVPKP